MSPAFDSVRIVGGLLSADVIGKIYAGDSDVPGIAPQTYGLEPGESARRQASRVWPYLLEVWQDFKTRMAASPDAATARQTRERWLHILLRELGLGPLHADGAIELDGKSFPVSHRFADVPVHLLGWRIDLDHRTPQVTARAPHAMVQELLNRSDAHLWAIVSNGSVLRLLRDSATLTGQAYAEFDLEAIFDGELFADFVRLYLVCHSSRFLPAEGGVPASCYLEQWRAFSATHGERALKQLRGGVERAIGILGTGFLSHPDNPQLRHRLHPDAGELRISDFNRALLRVVYRLLFWFVAEDRGALLMPLPGDGPAEESERLRTARHLYETYCSSARLRRLARRRHGDRHSDLWEAVKLVFDALGTEGGEPSLALPGLGGIFETTGPDGHALPLDEPLGGVRLRNQDLLAAVRELSLVKSRDGGGQRTVDFGNLDSEELGSIYEGLLEQVPRYDAENLSYTLEKLAGNERKESGSFYTPSALVECLLDSTLDPLLDEACKAADPAAREKALLEITVCDPACGSGHFLLAAARRLAKRVAAEQTGEPEPPTAAVRHALRQVVGQCIYGVDINPMAVELARVSLWLEALEPGKPLSFLDQNIRVGNSLLGTTPELLNAGLPDGAFAPLEGDDRKVVTALKKQNAEERSGQGDLFDPGGIPVSNAAFAEQADQIAHTLPDSLEDLHIQQRRRAAELSSSVEWRRQKLLADAWCAAFVQRKTEEARRTAITQATLKAFGQDSGTLESAAAEELVDRIARQYRFFHWHIEFPHIFRVGNGTTHLDPATGWEGGFSCVIGNPPWERVKLQEKEFFATRDERITNARNAAERKRMIAALEHSADPGQRSLFQEFRDELRVADGWSHFLRTSDRYLLTGQGDINTYAVFAETARTVIGLRGRSGLVLPTGIATDATTAPFFSDLVRKGRLIHVFGFRNNRGLFKNVGHGDVRFCLLAFTGQGSKVDGARFAFDLGLPDEIRDHTRVYELEPNDITLVNPNTGNCPTFKSRKDAELVSSIYRRVPILWRESPEENPWGLSFMSMFHMANDSDKFYSVERLDHDGWSLARNAFINGAAQMLPLYEGKMVFHFDHRFGDYRDRADDRVDSVLPRTSTVDKMKADFAVLPRYWVAGSEVTKRLARRDWNKGWLLGWRDIARSTDERTVVSTVIPQTAVGDKFLLAFTSRGSHLLMANLSTFVLDYCARQKHAGTSLKYYLIKQFPVLPPDAYKAAVAWLGSESPADWFRKRVLELSYTAWDIAAFARDLDDDGPPFRWDEERRFAVRAELDAAYFHLYGIDRDDVDYIMETFPIVKRKDIERHGTFRTKELILAVYDQMADAARTGTAYESPLTPPPGQGSRHPARPASSAP